MLEIIYKNVFIFLLTLFLVILAYTAYLFTYSQIGDDGIYLHKVSGVLLILFSAFHIYSKRKKLKKLTLAFIRIFTKTKATLDNDMDIFIDSFERQSLGEISTNYGIPFEELNNLLIKNDIKNATKEQTLKYISEQSGFRVFTLIVKILGLKTKK